MNIGCKVKFERRQINFPFPIHGALRAEHIIVVNCNSNEKSLLNLNQKRFDEK